MLPAYREGLIFDKDPEQILAWCNCVEHISQPGNYGVVGDTGTGKTVVALLLAYKLWHQSIPGKMLLLVPRKMLTIQHQQGCWNVITAQIPHLPSTVVVTGESEPWQRHELWQQDALIFFATPQTIVQDLKAGRLTHEQFAEFRIIVFDEMHRARGKYAYVAIAAEAVKTNAKIIGLTASPGGTSQRVEELKQTLYLNEFVRLEMPMPSKTEELITIELDDNLQQLDQLFRQLLTDIGQEIAEFGFDIDANNKVLTISALNQLLVEINSVPEPAQQRWATSLHAEYYKLRHLYTAAMSESYASFTSSLEKLQRDNTQASQRILAHPIFQQAADLIHQATIHPKVRAALSLLTTLKEVQEKVLVFVYTKATAQYLTEQFNQQGIRTAMLHGGRGKAKLQNQLVDQLRQGELDVIVATSVAEEGIHVPEVGVVIHYYMPITEIARIQRSGRTGRKHAGRVIYLCMDHPLDQVPYWVTRNKERKMREVIRKQGEVDKPSSAYRKRPSKRCRQYTLALFGNVFPPPSTN